MSTPIPPDRDPLFFADDAFVASCLKMLRGELDKAACDALAKQLDADAGKRRLYVQLAIQSQLVGDVLSLHPVDEKVDESQDPYAADIMAEVVESIRMQQNADQVAKEAADKAAQEREKSDREHRERLRLTQHVNDRPVPRVIVIPKLVAVLGIAAMVGLVAWLGWYVLGGSSHQQGGSPPITEVDLAPVYATVVRSLDARWKEDADLWNGSSGLRRGRHHLSEGMAEIKLTDGTHVILEAPISFELTGTNAMALTHGRLVATVPPAAIGFTVDTPTARITDYGTEFGVRADGQSFTQTFSGQVGISPIGSDEEVQLYAGEAVVADALGQIQASEPDALAFVREEEFQAILNADHSERDRWVAARYRMLRDPSVVAFVPFIQPGDDWPGGLGYQRLRMLDETAMDSRTPARSSYGEAVGWQDGIGIGDALVANGQNPIFIDLDTTRGGAFDAAGLLDGNGMIGRPGTTLYIMWRMQGDGSGHASESFAGLSLMRGDVRVDDEPLFVGCTALTTNWSVHPRHNGQIDVGDVAVRPLTAEGRPLPMDDQSHLWLVRVDFAQGPDRIQVYLDPDLDAAQLPQPNVLLTDYDVSFDRLRFVTGDGAMAWRVDDVLISKTRPTGSLGMLPRD